MAPTPHVRRSQQERSTATRERLLDATVQVLAAHGYAATTTLRIQQVANVTRGRLLHQYPSREALLIDAVQHLATARFRELAAQAVRIKQKDRLRNGIQLLWSTHDGPLFWAAMELWLAARSEEALRAALVPAERQLGQVIRDLADTLFGNEIASHPLYPMWRDDLVSSMRGVALTYALERRQLRTDPHLRAWEELGLRVLERTPLH